MQPLPYVKLRYQCQRLTESGESRPLIDWPSTTDLLSLQSAEECGYCGRVDSQETVRQCDANCGGFFHEACTNHGSARLVIITFLWSSAQAASVQVLQYNVRCVA